MPFEERAKERQESKGAASLDSRGEKPCELQLNILINSIESVLSLAEDLLSRDELSSSHAEYFSSSLRESLFKLEQTHLAVVGARDASSDDPPPDINSLKDKALKMVVRCIGLASKVTPRGGGEFEKCCLDVLYLNLVGIFHNGLIFGDYSHH